MGIYFIVLFAVIVVSLITGILLNIHDNRQIKKRIKNNKENTDNVLAKTIRINRLEGLDYLFEKENKSPVLVKENAPAIEKAKEPRFIFYNEVEPVVKKEKKEPRFIFCNEIQSKLIFSNYSINEEIEVI